MVLRKCELTTKMFCVIALGMAQNSTLKEIALGNNFIDERSFKTFETLIRYVKNLETIEFSFFKRVDQSGQPLDTLSAKD